MQTMVGIIVPASLITMVLAVVAVVVVLRRRREGRGKRQGPDYRGFFIMGIVWFPLGLLWTIVFVGLALPPIITLPFTAIGLAYLIHGLTNRDKWDRGKNKRPPRKAF